MRDYLQNFIDGRWVPPCHPDPRELINPATETVIGHINIGSSQDVDKAVHAARQAFPSYSGLPRTQRVELLSNIVAEYGKRYTDMAEAISDEMGAPLRLANEAQAALGLLHLKTALAVLKEYRFDEIRGTTLITHEPIGVCGLITPWNWPINQITTKVAPALAVGCTMVLKPSEIAPFSAALFTEILAAAGVPAGVFNLVFGDGAGVGTAIAAHPGIDMISFTGSTRAGVEVARNAAATVKRVQQELGGKSANILLDDADFSTAVASGIAAVMLNSGQSCTAPTRMLVPSSRLDEVKHLAAEAATTFSVGDPRSGASLGPVVSAAQWEKVQQLILSGIDAGASLVAGGPGRPAGFERGYYVKPTIFADVQPDMRIAREEIFGPVLVILDYADETHAITLANDTDYGLTAYVQSSNLERAHTVARQLRAGQVSINYAAPDFMAPVGGYKMSGNGREWGDFAFAEYLEIKSTIGFVAQAINA